MFPDPPFNFSDCPADAEEDHEVALKALAKLKDTWKYLQGEMACAVDTLVSTIHACCQLHNTVMDMEDDAAMPGVEEPDYCGEVRQLENEDAVRVRNMLSQYFLASKSSKSGGELTHLNSFGCSVHYFSYLFLPVDSILHLFSRHSGCRGGP